MCPSCLVTIELFERTFAILRECEIIQSECSNPIPDKILIQSDIGRIFHIVSFSRKHNLNIYIPYLEDETTSRELKLIPILYLCVVRAFVIRPLRSIRNKSGTGRSGLGTNTYTIHIHIHLIDYVC